MFSELRGKNFFLRDWGMERHCFPLGRGWRSLGCGWEESGPSCPLPLVSAAPGNAPSPTTGPAPPPPAASAAPPPGTAAAAAARPAAATPAVGAAAAAAAGAGAGAGAGPALAAAPAPAAPAWAPAAGVGVGVEATARQTATPARGAKWGSALEPAAGGGAPFTLPASPTSCPPCLLLGDSH